MIRSTLPPADVSEPAPEAGTPARWSGALCGALLSIWFAYLLIAPTLGIDWIDSWHNEQRVLQVILLVASALCLTISRADAAWRGVLPTVPGLVWVILAIGLWGALRARYRDAAFAELGLHALLLALVLYTAAAFALAPQRCYRWMRWGALLLLATYVGGVAVRYGAALAISQPLNLDVLLLGYANPRFPSALHALLIPFAADLALDPSERRSLRTASVLVLVLVWAVNLALGTRAIWFAYFFSFLALFAWLGVRRLGGLARITGAAAAAGAAVYVLLFKWIPIWTGIGETFTERTLDRLVWGSNRELLIRSSWDAIVSAPVLGLGPMQFAAIPQVWAAHPHNWILQLASEWGLPATALALYGLWRLFRAAAPLVQAATPEGHRGGAALTIVCASTVALVYGLVDGNLVMPVSQSAAALLFGVLAGLVLAARRAPASRRPVPARPAANRRAVALGLALLWTAAAAELCWFTAITVGPATAQEAAQSVYPNRTLWPRYWSDGFLPIQGDPMELQGHGLSNCTGRLPMTTCRPEEDPPVAGLTGPTFHE